MKGALESYNSTVDYINTHGTSTPVGDVAELKAIKELFTEDAPIISSTKSMTGHSLGATGAQEAIYSIMMLNEGFIAPNINVEQFCEEASGLHINKETVSKQIRSVMSNSFGFGGTNASLILTK
jgi:3-oxoacyl-[acyl-carrier-protein] synthase-1